MLDPFPVPAPEPLRALSVHIANTFALPALPLHAHEILFALGFYAFVAQVISPAVSARLFPAKYPRLDHRTKINWHVHVVSLVQSCIINTLSLYILLFDEERKAWAGDENWHERIWGYTGLIGFTQSFALGYFLWDLYISLRYVHIFGVGLLAHALCCCTMFVFGFRPFVHFYCPVFLLHELSSPFLNIHWFCDKLGYTGSIYQAVNGVFLVTAFFGSRIVWGTYSSVAVCRDVYRASTTGYVAPQAFQEKIAQSLNSSDLNDPQGQTVVFMTVRYLPMWLAASYLTVNAVLTALNFFWFSQMIQTIRKRFDPPFGTKGTGYDKVLDHPSDPTQSETKKVE